MLRELPALITIGTFVNCPSGFFFQDSSYYSHDTFEVLERLGFAERSGNFCRLTDSGERLRNSWMVSFTEKNRCRSRSIFPEFQLVDREFKQTISDCLDQPSAEPPPRSLIDSLRDAVDNAMSLLVEGTVDPEKVLLTHSARLSNSFDNIDAGYREYLSSPLTDSLHSIWFELHEILYVVSGHSRAEMEEEAG